MIDYARFANPRAAPAAVLIEAGQHWEPATVARMEVAGARLLHHAGLAMPGQPLPSAEAGPGILDELSTPPAPPTASQDRTVAADNDGPKAIAPVSLEVKSAEVVSAPTSFGSELDIMLTPASAAKFQDFTQAAVGEITQVLINDKVVIEPRILTPITGGHIVISEPDSKLLQDMAEQLTFPEGKILVRLRP
jgi:hypothetical protein